jgi:hypothetical protein
MHELTSVFMFYAFDIFSARELFYGFLGFWLGV